MPECELEIKGDQLLAILSARPEYEEAGQAFHGKIDNPDQVRALMERLIFMAENPTLKTIFTINDGLIINIQWDTEASMGQLHLESIQDNSQEAGWVIDFFSFCIQIIDQRALQTYLQKVISDFIIFD